jgi:hypothetical protein
MKLLWISLGLAAIWSTAASAAVEQTLSIIKPDAVQEKHIGDIISSFDKYFFKLDFVRLLFIELFYEVVFFSVV